AAQGGGDPLDLAAELGVGEDLAAAALVDVDQGGAAALAGLDVAVEAVVGEVGEAAGEPAEGGELPLEDAVPGAEPGQLSGGAGPERFGVLGGLPAPPPDDRVDQLHLVPPSFNS